MDLTGYTTPHAEERTVYEKKESVYARVFVNQIKEMNKENKEQTKIKQERKMEK